MNKKIVGTFALLMIALSVAGFVYAHWSDVIYINGTVDMGSLTFGFTSIIMCEDGKMMADGTILKPEPKDVGSVFCELAEPEVDPHVPDKTVYKKLWITITNGYPEYVAQCTYTLDNAGTIPLDVVLYCVPEEPVDTLTWRWYDGATLHGFIDLNGNGSHDPDEPVVINIWFTGFMFGQIDPCKSERSTINIHIKEPAEECHTYRFEIRITASQWN